MNSKMEITVDVIIHATEDISKIFQAFEELFDLKKEEFVINHTTGHFENPITMLNTKINKKRASQFMEKLLETLSAEQINKLVEEIEERTTNSRFHMRLDKQELVEKNLVLREKDTVKIKIHTPIYNKKDTVKSFTKIFQIAN